MEEKGQKTEDGRQKTEDRGRKTEDRKQKTEDRGGMMEDGRRTIVKFEYLNSKSETNTRFK